MGRAWVESPMIPLMWSWVPMFMVVQVVTDAFAGERERHTLETLLASRLPDGAILLGKLLAAAVYGGVFILAFFVLGTITVNVAFGQGTLLIYPPDVLAGLLLVMGLGVGLVCGAGVLVSMRAAGLRQAQQVLMIAICAVTIPLGLISLLLPENLRNAFFEALLHARGVDLMVGVSGVLLVLDVLLLLGARARFRRARLIL
jgi:ABC-2 type transport system permease protein